MSQRGKRPNRSDDGSSSTVVVPTKRRKCRPTAQQQEEEEAAAAAQAVAQAAAAAASAWQPRPLNDLKISSIYNRSATEAPAELFRKDLISAMKLPDSEPLALDEYWIINDQWKQEWERGVQVPVNPDSLPEPSVTVTQCANITKPSNEFRLPKNKYIRITKDEQFLAEEHVLSSTPAKAEAACSYDLDDCDSAWLHVVNGERAQAGLPSLTEDQLERVLERLELHCWDRIQTIMKNEEGLGIEYDENVICDVCRSPDSEEGNEMVFCDSCNICVHQACYGITSIPAGQWLCCTCALAQRPDCVLCPNKGGAMKCTRSGQKWAHVSCALWIPEVSIGCVERMEPITKISSIPQSRWALICVLCRERLGACIQCSVKTCKTAYHVTCAFKHGLEMRAIIEDENADDGVKLRSYCQKHSKKDKSVCSGSEDDDAKRKKRKDMTSEEKNQARAARLQEIEAQFDKHVTVKDLLVLGVQQSSSSSSSSSSAAAAADGGSGEVDAEALHYIYNYWKLKRRAAHNKPLLPPKSEDVDMLSHKQEQADLEKMKTFVQLRQDLERVRNLCYMVIRREKLSRTFFGMREQTFHKQAAVLSSSSVSAGTANSAATMTATAVAAVIEANHGPSIYDRLYSHAKAEDHTADFDVVLARIAGLKSPLRTASGAEDEKKPDLNGIIKDRTHKSLGTGNPYKRLYFNGSSKRRSGSLYGSSLSSASASEHESKPDITHLPNRHDHHHDHHHHTSTDNDKVSANTAARKKAARIRKSGEVAKAAAAERRRNRLSGITSSSRIKSESSSEEDIVKSSGKKDWSKWPRNRTLQQMDDELADKNATGTDSDELIPVRLSKPVDVQKPAAIYSDTDDSSDVSMKTEGRPSKGTKATDADADAHQNKLRTKAALKEFNMLSRPSAILKANTTNPATLNKKKPINTEDDKDKEKEKEKDKKDTAPLTATTQSAPASVPPPKNKKKKDYVPSELIVPQRQAAKKASENLKNTTSRNKDTAPSTNQSTEQLTEHKSTTSVGVDEKDKAINKLIKSSNKPKTNSREKEEKMTATTVRDKEREKTAPAVKEKENVGKATTTSHTKDTHKTADVFDLDKELEKEDTQEIFAYVPQRQAAKKAAEHIKSGLGKPAPSVAAEPADSDAVPSKASSKQQQQQKDSSETTSVAATATSVSKHKSNKEAETTTNKKDQASEQHDKVGKIAESKRRSTTNTTSSSSSSSSSTSSSSSSSESEEESPAPAQSSSVPSSKNSASLFSSNHPLAESKKNSSKDWPFLDKAAKSAVAPSSSSDSSDAAAPPARPAKRTTATAAANKVAKAAASVVVPSGQTARRKGDETADKVQTSVDRRPHHVNASQSTTQPTPTNRKSKKVIADKKLKTSDRRAESDAGAAESAASEREEPSSRVSGGGTTVPAAPSTRQPSRTVGRQPRSKKQQSNAGERVGDAHVRAGDVSDGQRVGSSVERRRQQQQPSNKSVADGALGKSSAGATAATTVSKHENRKRKSDDVGRTADGGVAENEPATSPPAAAPTTTTTTKAFDKESIKSRQLPSPVRKTDKKLVADKSPEKVSSPMQLAQLEREIMERKAGRDLNSRRRASKGTFDRLIEKRDKKLDSKMSPSVKENSLQQSLAVVGASKHHHRTKDDPSDSSDGGTTQDKKKKKRGSSGNNTSSSRYKRPEPLPDFRNKNSQESKTPDGKRTPSKTEVADKHKTKESKERPIQISVDASDEEPEEREQKEVHKEAQEEKVTTEPLPAPKFNSTCVTSEPEGDKAKSPDRCTTPTPAPPAYMNRSIFSPQPSVKDSACSEIFDFDNDMLNVDESGNEDGFGMPRDPDEVMRAPLTFAFSNEFLFKEDSKEDSARETLNLVEKLRMGMSKKSTASEGADEMALSNVAPLTAKNQEEEKTFAEPLDERAEDAATVAAEEKEKMKAPDSAISTSAASLPDELSEIEEHSGQLLVEERGASPRPEAAVSYMDPAVAGHNSSSAGFHHFGSCGDAEAAMQQHLELSVKALLPLGSAPHLHHHLMSGEIDHHRVSDERWPNNMVDGFPSLDPDVAAHLQQAAAAFLPPPSLVPGDLHHLHQDLNQQQQHQLQHHLHQHLHHLQQQQQGTPSHGTVDRQQQQLLGAPATPSFLEQTSMDCLGTSGGTTTTTTAASASASPYIDLHHQQAKWADSEVLPVRRSSSSSAASSTSSGSGSSSGGGVGVGSRAQDDLLAGAADLLANANVSAADKQSLRDDRDDLLLAANHAAVAAAAAGLMPELAASFGILATPPGPPAFSAAHHHHHHHLGDALSFHPTYSSEASQFVSAAAAAVGPPSLLFSGGGGMGGVTSGAGSAAAAAAAAVAAAAGGAQMPPQPFPSPGAAAAAALFSAAASYGAAVPFSSAQQQQQQQPTSQQHHVAQPCTAAFTSSSHNMAFTAAMVSLPSLPVPPPLALPLPDQQQQQSDMQPRAQPTPPPPLCHEEQQQLFPATATTESAVMSPATPVANVVPPLATMNATSPTVSSGGEAAAAAALPPPPPPPPPAGKKSPSKPTRTSARVTSLQQQQQQQQLQQNKSPGKSPGKSPRQQQAEGGTTARTGSTARRGGGRGGHPGRPPGYGPGSRGRGSRGRGARARGASNHHHHMAMFGTNTIHNKLVGTVYDLDFDDDINDNNNMEILRMMRERRRSTDTLMHVLRDSTGRTDTNTMTSPTSQHGGNKGRATTDLLLRELRPTSVHHLPQLSGAGASSSSSSTSPLAADDVVGSTRAFADIGQPVLPGPVDMRTYNPAFDAQQTAAGVTTTAPTGGTCTDGYAKQMLNVFASGTADHHQLPDIDEDEEKALHSVLTAGKTQTKKKDVEGAPVASLPPPEPPAALPLPSEEQQPVNVVKVSLSDSRNQLKVKIKGPFLDAKYATTTAASTVAPLPPPAIAQDHHHHSLLLDGVTTSSSAASAGCAAMMAAAGTGGGGSSSSSGTSNLRRMRKKELLRQYWTQDMNMDEPASGAVSGQAAAPAPAPHHHHLLHHQQQQQQQQHQQVSRTIITIPKAVASMTSIPTREDYKAVVDANMEKKRRKDKTAAMMDGSAPGHQHHHHHLYAQQHQHQYNDYDEEAGALSGQPERRRSVGSAGSDGSTYRRKGRPPKHHQALPPLLPPPTTPKLKIKFGGAGGTDAAATTCTTIDDDDRYRQQRNNNNATSAGGSSSNNKGRPPKKRLPPPAAALLPPPPSVEDLRRESMKYRKMVMADFDEERKKRSHHHRHRHRDSSDRKKRRRPPKQQPSLLEEGTTGGGAEAGGELRIISNESATPTKLIIRFGRKRTTDGDGETQHKQQAPEDHQQKVKEKEKKQPPPVPGQRCPGADPGPRTEQATDGRTAAPPSTVSPNAASTTTSITAQTTSPHHRQHHHHHHHRQQQQQKEVAPPVPDASASSPRLSDAVTGVPAGESSAGEGQQAVPATGTSALRKVRSAKMTPIRLKISRCQEGSGYVMHTNTDSNSKTEVTVATDDKMTLSEMTTIAATTATTILDTTDTTVTTTATGTATALQQLNVSELPLNKDCQVR